MSLINDYLNYIQKENLYSKNTVVSYKNDLHQFINYLKLKEENELLKVDRNDIRNYIIFLSNNKYKPSSIHRKIAVLKGFYKFLLRKKIIEKTPLLNITLPKKIKRLPSFILEEEIEKLLNINFHSQRDRIIFIMLLYTGMRCSELTNLKLDDIDLNKKQIKILGKRSKERIIPIGPFLVKEIEEYLKFREKISYNSNYFIVTDKGKKAYSKLIYRTINKYLKIYSRVNKKSPHVLRHTIATLLLNKGTNINVIKEFLGHANLAATQIYTHTTIESLKNIYKKTHPRT